MTIGDRVKMRRKELGLSVDELSEKLNKNRATIYRYEKGDIESMPVTVLEPLAAALHTTPAALMGWESSDKDIDLKSDEKTLLNGYRQLDDMDKGIVQGEVRQLLRDDKYQREKAVNE